MTDRELLTMALKALELEDMACRYEKDPTPAHIANLITALRAAIEQPETELETYKRLYELRGKALERPCSNCGHQPAKIKTMAQPEQEPVACPYCKNSHTLGAVFFDQNCAGCVKRMTSPASKPWVGLTDDEIALIVADCAASAHRNDDFNFARAIEAKLKERNRGMVK